jgi:exoribonuclease II
MTQATAQEIVPGTVLEFFDDKKMVCGVCLDCKDQRLAVLSEQNREINLSRGRVLHFGLQNLSLGLNRDDLVQRLATITAQRRALMGQVAIEELWSLLEGEERRFGARELAEYIFSESLTDDHVAAVLRVMLADKLYFKYKAGEFTPRNAAQLESLRQERERTQELERLLQEGVVWLQKIWQRQPDATPPTSRERLLEAIKSFCLFGQESPDYTFARELLKRAGIVQPQGAFRLLVRLGIWNKDENLYLHQHGISAQFPSAVLELAEERVTQAPQWLRQVDGRRDLRELRTITIDSALTRDYDDALSLRPMGEGLFELGIHIADAAAFVQPGDALDQEALDRASSLYLPDSRIAMLPQSISEGVCSLRAHADRLAVSFLVVLDEEANIVAQEIVPSVVRVNAQMTYQEVNQQLHQNDFLQPLQRLSSKLQQRRLDNGAIILPLPELRVWVNPEGMIQVTRYEKETPSQIMVSELMILANTMAAGFFSERRLPSIFRCQEKCRPETNPVASEYALFHVYRQRRLFARAELTTSVRPHCSVGVPHYTSVTSPIRRYVDLLVQRQLRHVIEIGSPLYSEEDLQRLITQLEVPQSRLMLIRRKWTRYWILKYLEQEDIQTLDALVLDQNNRFAHLLLPDFILETNMLVEDKTRIRPGEMIRVKLDHLNPRDDILRVKQVKG